MKTIYKALHAVLCRHLGFTVIGIGYGKRHYAMREREALAWAGCYHHSVIIVQGAIVAQHKHAA